MGRGYGEVLMPDIAESLKVVVDTCAETGVLSARSALDPIDSWGMGPSGAG